MTSQEKEIVEDDCYLLRDATVKPVAIFDIGANVGTFSLYARSLFDCPIFAYEPFNPQWSTLCKSVNPYPDIFTRKAAFTKFGGYVGKDEWPMTEQDRIGGEGEKSISYQLSTITYYENCLFKIDIEGEEFNLLPEIEQLCQKNWVRVEIHGNRPESEDMLSRLNYTTYGNRNDIFVARINPQNK
jgi:FkbM family methyltransferase